MLTSSCIAYCRACVEQYCREFPRTSINTFVLHLPLIYEEIDGKVRAEESFSIRMPLSTMNAERRLERRLEKSEDYRSCWACILPAVSYPSCPVNTANWYQMLPLHELEKSPPFAARSRPSNAHSSARSGVPSRNSH